MSALNLLRAYRYPQVAACARGDLTPERFLDGNANTIYVVAAGHDQEALRPVILALVAAMYEAAIVKAREQRRARPAAVHPDGRGREHRAGAQPRAVALAVRGPRHRDRDDLAVDRADRPALRPRRPRRDLRGVDRAGVHAAAGGADERRLSDRAARRGAGRQRLHLDRALAAHAEHRPSEGRSFAVAAPDRPRDERSSSTATCRPRSCARPAGSRTPGSRATRDCSARSYVCQSVICDALCGSRRELGQEHRPRGPAVETIRWPLAAGAGQQPR